MLIFLTFLGCLLVILLLGKREPADLTLPKVSIITGVDHYLEQREKEVLGLQPGVCKEVIWAETRGKKTNEQSEQAPVTKSNWEVHARYMQKAESRDRKKN